MLFLYVNLLFNSTSDGSLYIWHYILNGCCRGPTCTFFPTYRWSFHLDQQESLQIIIFYLWSSFCFFSLIRPSGFRLLILFTLLKIFPLGKITSRGGPEDVPKKHPDVIRTSPYGPICNTKGGICSGKSLGRTQNINLTIIHQMSF